jgi:hypothetical protein
VDLFRDQLLTSDKYLLNNVARDQVLICIIFDPLTTEHSGERGGGQIRHLVLYSPMTGKYELVCRDLELTDKYDLVCRDLEPPGKYVVVRRDPEQTCKYKLVCCDRY